MEGLEKVKGKRPQGRQAPACKDVPAFCTDILAGGAYSSSSTYWQTSFASLTTTNPAHKFFSRAVSALESASAFDETS